jgi:hypothetical protein
MAPVKPYASDDAVADWRRFPPSGADLPRQLNKLSIQDKSTNRIRMKSRRIPLFKE